MTNGNARRRLFRTVKKKPTAAVTSPGTPRRLSVFATMIALEAADEKATAAFKRAADATTPADEEAALVEARHYSRVMDGLVAGLEGRAA